MQILPFPTENKSQMLTFVLSSGERGIRVLQSVQRMTPSMLTPSLQISKNSGRATEEGSLLLYVPWMRPITVIKLDHNHS